MTDLQMKYLDLQIHAKNLHEHALVAYWCKGDKYHEVQVQEQVEKVKKAIAAYEEAKANA